MRRFLFVACLLASASSASASDIFAPVTNLFSSALSVFDQGVEPPPYVEGANPNLWRGHFSGGRNAAPGAVNIALDWTDQVAFFPSDHECRRWIGDLRRAYRTYEGFGGCLRIR